MSITSRRGFIKSLGLAGLLVSDALSAKIIETPAPLPLENDTLTQISWYTVSSSSVEVMRLDSSGNLGIGVTPIKKSI